MANFSKKGARKLRAETLGKDRNTQGEKMARQLVDQFNQLHNLDRIKSIKEVEELLLKQHQHEISLIDSEPTYPTDIPKFNPSGASKCNLELYKKVTGVEPHEDDVYAYHRRWTRNATAVHGAIQKDLLLCEQVLPDPKFTVVRTSEGLPAWEQSILSWKEFNHKGQRFIINGMMDGLLEYKSPDGTKTIGFEFKTKSNTIGQVGHYKMKAPTESHQLQCVAYSLLFGVDEFIIFYESLAKDGWFKRGEAKPDMRSFHLHVTEEMRQELLDKFAYVTACAAIGEEPREELEKCIFCPFKYDCTSYQHDQELKKVSQNG
ncbi:hypothetical protein [Bacillus sp. NPDC077027]|uniref:hypothetical protein n=1 Tax=Bacillus sp. NPDC077027 TaxID=3390548 RepID=UPI003CFBE106